jgi:hypothetical protein
MIYDDPGIAFQRHHFQMFSDVVDDYFYTTSQEWVMDLNIGSESLVFE